MPSQNTIVTDAEFSILHQLWSAGPMTIGQIRNRTSQTRTRSSRAATDKLARRLRAKHLVAFDLGYRPFLVVPAISRAELKRQELSLLEARYRKASTEREEHAIAIERAAACQRLNTSDDNEVIDIDAATAVRNDGTTERYHEGPQ